MAPLNVSSEVDAYLGGFLREVGIDASSWLPRLPMAASRSDALLAMQALKEVKRRATEDRKVKEAAAAASAVERKQAAAAQRLANVLA